MAYHTELLPEPLPADPLVIFDQWMTEALQKRLQPNPNAMVLATVGPEGDPSARVVLCKGVVPHPGYVVFYTNYHSLKGRQLAVHPRAAAVIHWDPLHRQIRLEGPVVQSPRGESDTYFASRPWQSRLGAWASEQSEPVPSRAQLKSAVEAAAKRFGTNVPDSEGASPVGDPPVPRPPHWGGYRLWIEKIELWVEGAGRIHDRARWVRTLAERPGQTFETSSWSATRLQP
jgi:pyridoxamine 5'-phosphate oxidase